MEGQGERGSVTPVVELKKESREMFGKIERASAELTGKVTADFEMGGTSSESRLKVSAFARKELLNEVGDLDFASILAKAAEKGWKVVIYNPGVAWTGDQWASRESRKNTPRFFGKSLLGISSEAVEKGLSPEEKMEDVAKSAALDFLAEADYDICLTVDPASEAGFVSSLRADMGSRRTLMQTVEKELGEKGRGLLTSVGWSNGAFKEGMLHKAIFEAVAKKILGEDTGDDSGVFRNEREAVEFGSLYGKLGIDVYLGGGPADAEELAVPFKLTSDNLLMRGASERGMKLANWLIRKTSSLSAKYIPESKRLLVTRIQEMGRGKRSDDVNVEEALLPIQTIMRDLLGGARLISLADTSGSVVASDRQHLGDDLRLIYGDKTIMLETHQEKPLPKGPGEVGSPAYSQAEHGEIKREFVLRKLKQIVKEIKEGTFNRARNEQERYVVVSPESKEYEQKKKTFLRLNPLPRLGSV